MRERSARGPRRSAKARERSAKVRESPRELREGPREVREGSRRFAKVRERPRRFAKVCKYEFNSSPKGSPDMILAVFDVKFDENKDEIPPSVRRPQTQIHKIKTKQT